MQSLTLDPAIPFPIPADLEITLALVGCGGTGSHIAQALVSLAVHCRDKGGPELHLMFIDGDTVERKNVGRQLFSPGDVGRNKAQALAGRLGAAFGLKIHAFPEMLNGQNVVPDGYGVLVGAVDSTAGRREIARELDRYAGRRWRDSWHLWLDCGNHEYSGQVCVGGELEPKALANGFQMGLCSRLPAPSLVYPDLLKEAPIVPRADCAAAMEDNNQSLMVNRMVASIAGQYLSDVVIQRQLTTFTTTFDLRSKSMRSLAITATNVATATGIDRDVLLGTKAKPNAKRKARAA